MYGATTVSGPQRDRGKAEGTSRQSKSARTMRRRAARVSAKWQSRGWELKAQSQGLFRTTTIFKRPKVARRRRPRPDTAQAGRADQLFRPAASSGPGRLPTPDSGHRKRVGCCETLGLPPVWRKMSRSRAGNPACRGSGRRRDLQVRLTEFLELRSRSTDRRVPGVDARSLREGRRDSGPRRLEAPAVVSVGAGVWCGRWPAGRSEPPR